MARLLCSATFFLCLSLVAKPAEEKNRRRWCQFSFRILAAATTLMGVGMFWYGQGDRSPGFELTKQEEDILGKMPLRLKTKAQLDADLAVMGPMVGRYLRILDDWLTLGRVEANGDVIQPNPEYARHNEIKMLFPWTDEQSQALHRILAIPSERQMFEDKGYREFLIERFGDRANGYEDYEEHKQYLGIPILDEYITYQVRKGKVSKEQIDAYLTELLRLEAQESGPETTFEGVINRTLRRRNRNLRFERYLQSGPEVHIQQLKNKIGLD